MKTIETKSYSSGEESVIILEKEFKAFSDSLEVERKIKETIDFEPLLKSLHEPFRSEKLIKSLAGLVFNLGDRLSEYDTLLSDDASGRLVTLLLRDVANRQRKEMKKRNIQTYFIAGGGYINIDIRKETYRAIWDFIKSKKDMLSKTLLVTEHTYNGKGMIPLVKILESLEIDFGIATISIENLHRGILGKIKDKDELFYGSVGIVGLDLWGDDTYSGVRKDKKTPQAHPIKSDPSDVTPEEKLLVNQAREDIKTLGKELYKLIS